MIAVTEQPNSLPEIAFGDCLARRSNCVQAEGDMNETLAACLAAGIEIISLLPEWVELRVPCDLAAIPPLQELVKQLEVGLPAEVGEAITFAFREMVCNAVEYGGHLDPTLLVEVRLMRLKRAFICRIKDPGDGFDPPTLDHAAINNPSDNPVHHASVREEKGLRGGGFGILLASQYVDDLVYNDRHNEVVFVKYLF